MNEEVLIKKLIAGDETSFHWLVDAYQSKVIKICYRFFLQREDAEDVAQWVFIEIFQSIHKFKNECALSTWIFRIAVSKCLDELKKRKRKKRFSSSGTPLTLDSVKDAPEQNRRPDEKMEDKEVIMKLLSILEKLPENQRTALALSKIDGYQNQQIAEIMNLSLAAVDSLIYRAKKNLQTDIQSDSAFKK